MKSKNIRHINFITSGSLLLVIFIETSCKKMLTINNPVNEVTSNQVFSNDVLATAAMDGLYSNMMNASTILYCGAENGAITIYPGTSADELEFFSLGNTNNVQFQYNDLQSSNPYVNSTFWQAPYSYIYAANSIITGLPGASGIDDSVKNELIGEAEVVRGFVYFYLVNLFGNIPLVTNPNYQKNVDLARASTNTIYDQIITDLKDAQSRLPSNYSVGLGERIVPTKYAAAALLARTYLFTGDWADAYAESDTVISNSSLFNLVPLNQVFLKNSMEAIWQLKPTASNGVTANVTPEGFMLIPRSQNSSPLVYLTPQLKSAFEPGDERQTDWIDSTIYSGKTYYYPYKYKAGVAQYAANGPETEYFMMLRLGEQYLIRAETQAHGVGNGIGGAVSDLNTIRGRASAPLYSGPMDAMSVLDSIYHERQVELFAEWGHRWLDLKRTGQAATVLGLINYKHDASTNNMLSNNALLYPIPLSELKTDPSLIQNTGY